VVGVEAAGASGWITIATMSCAALAFASTALASSILMLESRPP